MKVPNHNVKATQACVYSNGFSKEELDELDTYLNKLTLQSATVGEVNETPDKSVRVSEIRFFYPEDLPWFSLRMHGIIDKVNKEWFKVNIEQFTEGFQYTTYRGEDKGHYQWHVDSHGGKDQITTRKLSMVLMLSDYKDYKGGIFQERLYGNVVSHALQKGDILIMPSHALHRVKPVTEGIRRTVVAWLGGPQWI